MLSDSAPPEDRQFPGEKEEDEGAAAPSIHPIVRQIIDRDCHVGSSDREVIRHVISKLRGGFDAFRQMDEELRQSLIDQCIHQHSQNRQLYVEVMSGFRQTIVGSQLFTELPTALTGKEVASLMRRNKVTIKVLSERLGISMKRIRTIRQIGLSEPLALRDWIQSITGNDLGPVPKGITILGTYQATDCSLCGFPFVRGDTAWQYLDEVFCSVACCRKSRKWRA